MSQAAADAVVNEIKANGGVAVANTNSVVDGDKIVATAIENFGRIDIVVNNAGILRDTSFIKMTKKEWDAVLNVHLQGSTFSLLYRLVIMSHLCVVNSHFCFLSISIAFAVTHAAWPHMRKQKYGRVIFVTSVNGLYGQFGQTNYSAAKAAMVGFGKSLSKEGERSNIKVNVLAPGAGSSMTKTILPEEVVNKWKPEYVAPCVAFLCHEDCPVTGQVFESGGGWMAQVKYTRSEGHYFDLNKEMTIEDVQNNWKNVVDFGRKTEDPENGELSPQLRQILNPNAKL